MIVTYKHTLAAVLAFTVLIAGAREPEFNVKRGGRANASAKAAQADDPCSAASAVAQMGFNNVNARIENGGNMWQDRGTSSSSYAVPKGANPQTHAIFAGALWMGGLAPDQTLKLAAVTFRTNGGNDFWPGPLTNDGTAVTNKEECDEWDRFFVTSKQQALRHNAAFNEGGAGTPSGYETPQELLNWPAHGGPGQDNILAPFVDVDDDGSYDAESGDYPGYDLEGNVECRSSARFVPLFGDTTIYWIFNDKGDVHSETNSEPIGMEIRAQAFAFSSEDEVNNMTFYNYVLINQGSQTLTNTYFGQWVDADLGNAVDDYVGCDVQRGLGYCYNGDNTDETGQNGQVGYGENPPAIGVDFFEGPFQDNDWVDSETGEIYVAFEPNDSLDMPFDNPLAANAQDAYDSLGIPYKGLGIGYGDDVPNNERFGMRKFLFYTNGGGVTGDPGQGPEYYNYLRGIWLDGSNFIYGGNGHTTGNGDPNQLADFMFPGDSDPLGFGTGGSVQQPWTEVTAGNQPGDRRFMQSAGPFTLLPGDVNNITVGVVYARATSGGALASVDAMRVADDKAQQLFDNCFQILEGPDAPDLKVTELDKELILTISNPSTSNNNVEYNEDYVKLDPRATAPGLTELQRSYVFQGYKVYQLKNQDVSIADVNDPAQARLIYQVDIKDTITTLVNYTLDPDIKVPVPEIMVQGTNQGIKHTFSVKTDQFAQGNNLLVNHKSYYFVAIAYAYNNYEPYNPVTLTGQAVQYLSSRKNGRGGAIAPVSGIPHKPRPNEKINVQYGTDIDVTRLEGRGNGTFELKISDETRERMFNAPFGLDTIDYEPEGSPVLVEIVDPLNVAPGKYEINVLDSVTGEASIDELDDATFELVWYAPNGSVDTEVSKAPLSLGSEVIFPRFGLAVNIGQYEPLPIVGIDGKFSRPAEILSSEIVFDNPDSTWLIPISDAEGETGRNWILSGTFSSDREEFNDIPEADPLDQFEDIAGGGLAPFAMVAAHDMGPLNPIDQDYRYDPKAYVANNPNVDIIFTPDTSKWTRCIVLENSPNVSDKKNFPKSNASVDKEGNAGTPQADLINATGMGWFPGYAIDIETGDRLNMAFSENSEQLQNFGNDMIYNPNDGILEKSPFQNYEGAGLHYIFVFKNVRRITENPLDMPAYDSCRFAYSRLRVNFNQFRRAAWSSCAWVGLFAKTPNRPDNPETQEVNERQVYNFLSTEARISVRIARPYERITTGNSNFADTSESLNNWNPKYMFTVPEEYKYRIISPGSEAEVVKNEILDLINVVPNPYYAYASYENGRLDTRIRFTNLPEEAEISIYTANGTLVKRILHDSELSFVDWNLKNEQNIPIASGTYLIHFNVPNVGERIIKWFGVMRKPALQNL